MRRALLAVVALLALVAPVALRAPTPTLRAAVAAASWYLVGEDGAVLARGDASRPRAVASITKLMTAGRRLEQRGSRTSSA